MAPPVLHAYNLQELQTHLASVETPAVLVVHSVASLSEAVEVYGLADAASRERGWVVEALLNLSKLGGVATEFDRLRTSIIPNLIADPSRKADLLLLRNLAFSVRHYVRRLDCAGLMRHRVDPLTNRLLRMARRVISGQSDPASLSEQLPTVAAELDILMGAYYFPIEQGAPPRIDIHNFHDLTACLQDTDGRAEVVLHGVASLAEALQMFTAAATAARDRGWTVVGLSDFARFAALAVEVDRLSAELLPRVITDPTTMGDVFLLKNSASTVRRHARHVDSAAGGFRAHLDPLMNRLLGALRQVISGLVSPTLLTDELPAVRDELNVCATTFDVRLT